MHLPVAFRSLSRPSSPPIAKASTSRPCFLLYFFLVTLVVIPLLSLWYLPLYLLIYSYALCQRSYLRFAEFSRQGRFHATLSYILKKQRMCIGKSLSFACFVLFFANECFCLFCPCGHSIKEVFQPHLPVRLPCYDFTPLTRRTLGTAPLAVGLATSGTSDSDGVTGGVYKARERIHRAMLMRDY